MPFDESAHRLTELIPPGSAVRLEYDVERQDRYGRDLAGVYADTSDGKILVNEVMVREGLARAVEYQPNTRFSAAIRAAEVEANNAHLGIHGVPPTCLLPTDVAKQALERYTQDPDPFYKAVMRDAVERTPNFTYREPALAFIDSL
ncbi:thermonuclease family protein [Corynebacterium aquatimens]|uniref:thermonuclease family protein n=1 Tax=Corynebacterium aquatimens TaxID=1190508 RepID=UPI00254099AE|nr:thermonuclease family protein [Corynebacterium aquatimens]QYH19565.1 thermonuclease family protein [Corynebacterium aquatimens]